MAHGKKYRRGEEHGMARLTCRKVSEMRRLYRNGLSGVEIASRFGIGESTAMCALKGQSWSHVPGALKPEEIGHPRGNMRRGFVTPMRQLYRDGLGFAAVAEHFDVHLNTAFAAIKGKTWKSIPGAVGQEEIHRRGHGAGAANWQAKLDDAKVAEMRRLAHEGLRFSEISERFGISDQTAVSAIRGATWRHVSEAPLLGPRRRGPRPAARISPKGTPTPS